MPSFFLVVSATMVGPWRPKPRDGVVPYSFWDGGPRWFWAIFGVWSAGQLLFMIFLVATAQGTFR